jgi:cytochrome P450
MARYEEVRASLMDWETFCSSAGVGLSDFRRETPWRPPSLILEADPPLHTRTRAVLTRILSAAAMKKLWTGFEQDAIGLIDTLVERGTFDAVRDLAEVYPLKVFPDAVGLAEEGPIRVRPGGAKA